MSRLAIQGGDQVFHGSWPCWPVWGERELSNLRTALDSPFWGGTTRGPMLQRIADNFARYCDCEYGIPMANGTVTLELSLRALGIGNGDEVIIPAFTFVAVPMAVLNVGAIPVFVDLNPSTLCIAPESILSAVTPSTKAIIPVHTAGQPADLTAILQIGKDNNLFVIEDCAQSHGAVYQGRKMGSFGHCGSYSFQQFKNMTCGEGGMVVTNDKDLAELLDYSLSKFGRLKDGHWYDHHRLATNATLTELQAAILLAQFDRLEEQTEKRANAGKYLIGALADAQGIKPLNWAPGTDRHGYHLFVFYYDADRFGGLPRERFVAALNAELGTEDLVGELYPRLLYETSMFDCERMTVAGAPGCTFRFAECPYAERASRSAVMIHQRALLADEEMLRFIPQAITKIQRHAGDWVTTTC